MVRYNDPSEFHQSAASDGRPNTGTSSNSVPWVKLAIPPLSLIHRMFRNAEH